MKGTCLLLFMAVFSLQTNAQEIVSQIRFKTAGNPAKQQTFSWNLTKPDSWRFSADAVNVEIDVSGDILSIALHADQTVHLNLQNFYQTPFRYNDSEFLLPGIWYNKNERSSKGSPTVNEAQSWSFREDRLSTPLTSVYDPTTEQSISILRLDNIKQDALAVPDYGEVILNAHSDLGSLGLGINQGNGNAYLQFGYPYQESPFTYTRKLTLQPQTLAFTTLNKGQSITLRYQIRTSTATNFAEHVEHTWKYSFDTLKPEKVSSAWPSRAVKSTLSEFFRQSYIAESELAGFSGVHITTANAERLNILEVGFIGRNLLNAFNALEYGEQVNDEELIELGQSVFTSYLHHGFDKNGFLREVANFTDSHRADDVLSIRRQSEGVYAILLYMSHQKAAGHDVSQWERKVVKLLNKLANLQRNNGSFPRKFTTTGEIIDSSGGSSASAVLALTMAYAYFSDSSYLHVAQSTATYLEEEIIAKSDYFSSTLDANCVDKEASFYTATAFYYLAMAVKDSEQVAEYARLAEKANYFVLSWYYTWDVPFAKGQMLGDVGFKTRGWGNVSVENNHVDVFIFGYLDVLKWLYERNNDERLVQFAQVIESSMKSQLLPHKANMYNIGKVGYYPEVVQHTNWDYGHFGKGFYNDIFAPGWVVASLWEMLTPQRAQAFFDARLNHEEK